MELSFNELEQRLLRFFKEEFLEKGGSPESMHADATMHRDVMDKFALEVPEYREIMARLEHHGIVEAIAIGKSYGHLRIHSVVVEIVRQLDERARQAKPEEEQPNRMEQAKRYFFGKWWFVVPVIAIVILGVAAMLISDMKTVLEWFGVPT